MTLILGHRLYVCILQLIRKKKPKVNLYNLKCQDSSSYIHPFSGWTSAIYETLLIKVLVKVICDFKNQFKYT